MKLNTASFALAATLLSSYTITITNAFTPITLNSQHPITFSSSIYASNEETVRDELRQKTTLVDAKDEIKYDSGVSGLPDIKTEVTAEATTTNIENDTNDTNAIQKKKLERILKPRAYPLFLAEKAALIGEEILDSIFNGGSKGKGLSAYELYQQKKKGQTKEKIVILGTGWGSAAFLKDIDTNMYDVTVISPRNFFLFTPM